MCAIERVNDSYDESRNGQPPTCGMWLPGMCGARLLPAYSNYSKCTCGLPNAVSSRRHLTRCCSGARRCRGVLRAATAATVLVECDGTPRRPVATEVESDLHQAPGRSVHRWKRPFFSRLGGESLEIAARTGSIRDGGEHRTILVDDDPHPYFDVSADGSTGALRNIRDHLMER